MPQTGKKALETDGTQPQLSQQGFPGTAARKELTWDKRREQAQQTASAVGRGCVTWSEQLLLPKRGRTHLRDPGSPKCSTAGRAVIRTAPTHGHVGPKTEGFTKQLLTVID